MVWEDATVRGLQVLSQLSPVQSQAPCVSGTATSPVPVITVDVHNGARDLMVDMRVTFS